MSDRWGSPPNDAKDPATSYPPITPLRPPAGAPNVLVVLIDDVGFGAARQMEIYAGFLEHTDHHVGRLLDTLEDLGILDNTLIYYIIGDNGASAEGEQVPFRDGGDHPCPTVARTG